MPLIHPTRRQFLQTAAAMPAFALPAAAASLAPPEGMNPAHFRFSLGQARITVLSDGHLSLPATGLGVNAPRADVEAFLTAHYLPTDATYSHTNHLLIELGAAVVLVDVGSGSRFLDTAGRLTANMESAGVDPAAITHVVITHAHPDHIWGIRDDFDEPLFPDAEYIIGATEHAHWMQDDLVNQVPVEAQQFVVGAVNSIETEGLDWTLAGEGHEVAPGITLIDTPGHTPGHMSLRIESDGQQLIALGDSLTHAAMSFARPAWVNGFDMIPDQTVTTRMRLLDMAATDRIALLGYHFPFPGVGHAMRTGDAYAFVPAMWQF